MTLTAYDTDYTAVVSLAGSLSLQVRNHALQSALARYDRGEIVAAFVDRYGERGQADVSRIASDIGIHTATLYEDIAVHRAFPDRTEFSHRLADVRSWSGMARLLPTRHSAAKNGTERAMYTDADCTALERTGAAIERIASDPPTDPVHRTELAGTLTVLARDALQAAVTLDPSMALEPSFVTDEYSTPWAGAFVDAFDDGKLSKVDLAMFQAWLAARDVDDHDADSLWRECSWLHRALMRLMENPKEPMSRKGR